MEFIFAILVIVLLVRWVILSYRLKDIEQRLEREASERASLAQRVHQLENAGSEPVSKPVPVVPPSPKTFCQFCGRSVNAGVERCFCGAMLKPIAETTKPPKLPEPVPVPVAVAVVVDPEPIVPKESLGEQLRRKAGDQEWEALVGGNWLNKIGVLLFVIGIALLLGYEFAHVGPVGRVALGMGISLTMLVGGVVLERRPLYRIFARGLIGGGWAALYFTTYSMHALEQVRVIDNPFLAAILLLAVAAGMIVHSLKYHSQTVSGLGYFIAFATLALDDNTAFSVLALVPLAASLLVLAYRFEWYRMAVFGVVATYATCASRPDVGAPLWSTQALFATYWLLFEAFDLLRLRRRSSGFTIESLILPLNALGFLGLSFVKWHRMAHPYFYAGLAAGATAYLASAILRAWLSPPREADTLDRMAAGGYEGPITLASALAAASIFVKGSGPWVNAALLIEGEVLFLAGLRFGQTYLRQLAGGIFGTSVVNLLAVDVPAGGTIAILKRNWFQWSPVTILLAACFSVNRAMRVVEGAMYSTAAVALTALVLGFETPPQYLCVSWLVFAALLLELGLRTNKMEFRLQSYAVGVFGIGAGVLVNLIAANPDWHRQWLPIAIAAAVSYAIALRIRVRERLHADEAIVPFVASASATAFLMGLAWKLAPAEYLGVAWLALGALLFELGLLRLPEQFRGLSYVVSAAGFLNLFYAHVLLAHKGSGKAEAWSLGLAALLCYALSARLFPKMEARIPDEERAWTRDLKAAAGTLFALTLAWLMLPAPLVALAWAVVSLVLLEVGFSFSLARFRLLGNLAGVAVFGRLFFENFTDLGNTLGISHRVLTVVPIVISQYFVWWRYQKPDADPRESLIARAYLYAPAILAVALMRFELGRSLAVVGWALLALVLYRTGLVRQIADLRRQSYPIAILAFWRCWNTNFYIPDSLAGIRGRLLTGAIVIASFYAAQLLSARKDRNARGFYSLLASVLLAVLLFYEVSGGALTMAWGVEGLTLLVAGFPLRDRLQRLSGLFLFLVCVLKLFFYDLRQLETFHRILSFIVLGVLLIGVSWIYTRFRGRIERYF